MSIRNISIVLIASQVTLLQSQHDKPSVSLIATLSDCEDHIFGFLSDMVKQTIFDQRELILVDLNPAGSECRLVQVLHPVKRGSTEYVKKYFDLDKPERSWVLNQESVAAGVVGFSRKSFEYLIKPFYEFSKNLRLFEDDYTAPDGFGMARYEQTAMSVHAYLNGLMVHHQDYNQTVPMQLAVDNTVEELYTTWDGHSVNGSTHIYSSRFEYKNFDACVNSIRFK